MARRWSAEDIERPQDPRSKVFRSGDCREDGSKRGWGGLQGSPAGTATQGDARRPRGPESSGVQLDRGAPTGRPRLTNGTEASAVAALEAKLVPMR